MATTPLDVIARRFVSRWRAFVAARRAAPTLLDVLERLPDLFQQSVLERLDPTDRTMLAQVGKACLAAVLASGLPRLPKSPVVRLQLREFCTSVERLAWAKANGCTMDRACYYAAAGGHLDVLRWAREHECPSASSWTGDSVCVCMVAAQGGHLDVLQWAREHGCPWPHALTCALAAKGGHLEVLRWARENGCPWDHRTAEFAAQGGHTEVLQWAREHGCPEFGTRVL